MPNRSLVLAVLAGLAAVGFLVERWIVTDREAIAEVVDRAVEAVREGDADALSRTLDPQFQGEGRDRASAVPYVLSLRRRYRPIGLEADVERCEVHGDQAEATAKVDLSVLARPLSFRLELSLRKTEDGWKILSARPSWAPE